MIIAHKRLEEMRNQIMCKRWKKIDGSYPTQHPSILSRIESDGSSERFFI